MSVAHLAADAACDEISEVLERDGCVVLDGGRDSIAAIRPDLEDANSRDKFADIDRMER